MRSNEKFYTLLLGQYETVEGLTRPTRLKFLEQSSGLEIELSLSDLRKVDAIMQSTFLLEPPSGVEVRTL